MFAPTVIPVQVRVFPVVGIAQVLIVPPCPVIPFPILKSTLPVRFAKVVVPVKVMVQSVV